MLLKPKAGEILEGGIMHIVKLEKFRIPLSHSTGKEYYDIQHLKPWKQVLFHWSSQAKQKNRM